MTEWRDIPGYPGYEISDNGLVWSKPRARTKGGLLQPKTSARGYHWIKLANRHVTIHTLVLETFVGPRPEGMVPRHLNGIAGDNRVENLRWEAEPDEVVYGTTTANKTHCKWGHKFTEANTHLRRGVRHCRACQRIRNKQRGKGNEPAAKEERSAGMDRPALARV